MFFLQQKWVLEQRAYSYEEAKILWVQLRPSYFCSVPVPLRVHVFMQSSQRSLSVPNLYFRRTLKVNICFSLCAAETAGRWWDWWWAKFFSKILFTFLFFCFTCFPDSPHVQQLLQLAQKLSNIRIILYSLFWTFCMCNECNVFDRFWHREFWVEPVFPQSCVMHLMSSIRTRTGWSAVRTWVTSWERWATCPQRWSWSS